MSVASIPIASSFETESLVESESVEMTLEQLIEMVKSLETPDLFKVMKTIAAELEKRTKGAEKTAAKASTKKVGSMPKGVVPPQLKKPRAWVDFTLQHALENGWEAFIVHQKKKNKLTGEEVVEETEMPGSVLHDGAYVYEGSVTEKQPAGRQIIHKEAMSLSKQRWAAKEKVGSHPELYAEFEASFVPEPVDASETASISSSVKKATTVIRTTAAEKAAAAAAKKAEKEAEKAAKKAEKEAEKAAKKAEKEAEKEAAKAAKAAEKAAKTKPTVVRAPIPAAAVKATPKPVAAPIKASAPAPAPIKAAAPSPKPVAAPIKAVAAPAPVPVKVVKAAVSKPVVVEQWSCPSGSAKKWSYKGTQYIRSGENGVWILAADGGYGEWQGVYLPEEDRIDDSVPAPAEDEEEADE